MKNKKKVIALFIAMFMVFSLVPSYAVQTSPQLSDEVTISEDADTKPASEKETLEETAIDNIQQDNTATENNTVLGNDNVDKKQLAEDSKNVEKAVTDSAVKATPKNSGSIKAPERSGFRTVLYSDGTLIINEKEDDETVNEEQHGAIIKTYLPYGTPYLGLFDDYTFYNYTDVLWYQESSEIRSVEFGSAIEPVSTAYWFYGLSNLIKVDFNNLNTSSVTNMQCMFYECASLTNLDLSNFNTSNVLDMSGMFTGCSSLTEIDVSHFNTSLVTDMEYMFWDCSSLNSLDLSSWNISNVENTRVMFANCANLSLTMKMNAVPAQSDDMFFAAATEDTADITLIPTSIQTEDWCNEQVLQYGSAGTITQGNIHLPYIDVTIDESINFSADTKGNISDTITIKNNGLCKISSKMSMNLSNGWEIVPNTSYITGKDQKKATLALNGTSLASANASNLEIESGASSQLTLNGKVGIFTKAIDEEFGKLVLEIENKYYSTNVYLSDEMSMDDTLVFTVHPELENPLNTLIKIWRSPNGVDNWEVWSSGIIGDGDNLLWQYNSPYFNLGFIGSVFDSDYWKVSVVVNDKEYDSNVITFGPQLIISYDQQNNILEATMKKITATSYNWEISFDNGKTWQDYPNGNSSNLTPEKNGIYRCTAIANGKSYQSGTITFTDKF